MSSSRRSSHSRHEQSDTYHPPYPIPAQTTTKGAATPMGSQRREMQAQWMRDLLRQVMAKDTLLTQASQKLHGQQEELDRLLLAKEESETHLKQLQTELYDRTKNIKVTDDDFSTIIAKLGKFTGKLSNFPPNSKSSFKKNRPKQEVIDFFLTHHEPEERKHIQFLFDQEPDKDKWDYALISVLVEKLITKEIVNTIYKAPIHLNPGTNHAFLEISKLYKDAGHEAWIKDLRLKMAKATYDSINQSPFQKKDMETRAELIDRLVTQLSELYEGPADIKSRIEKLVDMAIDLSLPIRGQEDLVKIYDLKETDVPRRNQVKPMYRHFEGQHILLGVSPVFLAQSTVDDEYNRQEEDEDEEEEEEGQEDVKNNTYIPNHTLVYQGKAIW